MEDAFGVVTGDGARTVSITGRERRTQSQPARLPTSRASGGNMSLFHTRSPSRETPNMGTPIRARNRPKQRFEKVSGINRESLPQIFGEYFCATRGWKESNCSKLFFDPALVAFPMSMLANEPTWFGIRANGQSRQGSYRQSQSRVRAGAA
jgi:hypothetical protein